MLVRYNIDYMFVLWPHGEDELEHFHQHLNKQYQWIQFTMEGESENGILFLDVQLQVDNKEGRISTRAYRKSTHTDRYIKYSYVTPPFPGAKGYLDCHNYSLTNFTNSMQVTTTIIIIIVWLHHVVICYNIYNILFLIIVSRLYK